MSVDGGATGNAAQRPHGTREYRFFTTEGEVSLEDFLAAVVRRGEVRVVATEARVPGYRLTAKGRRALEGAA
jgi:hypothetical protein